MPIASPTLFGAAPDAVPVVVAGVPTPVAVLFWLWFLVSIVVLGMRLVRRMGRGAEAGDEPDEATAVDTSVGAPPRAAPTPTPTPPGRPAPAADAAAADAAPSPPAAPPPVAGAGEARGGYFARQGGASTDSGGGAPMADTERRPTVAEALQGITMPCGLTPVTDGASSIPNPFRVAFLTTEADASAVGSGVGDELERLGYALSTATPTELVARRGGIEVRVVLHPTPSAARRGSDPLFPAAPPQSVGVEFTT